VPAESATALKVVVVDEPTITALTEMDSAAAAVVRVVDVQGFVNVKVKSTTVETVDVRVTVSLKA